MSRLSLIGDIKFKCIHLAKKNGSVPQHYYTHQMVHACTEQYPIQTAILKTTCHCTHRMGMTLLMDSKGAIQVWLRSDLKKIKIKKIKICSPLCKNEHEEHQEIIILLNKTGELLISESFFP